MLKYVNQPINLYRMNYQAHFKKGHAALESGQDFKLQKSEENLKRDKVHLHLDYIISNQILILENLDHHSVLKKKEFTVLELEDNIMKKYINRMEKLIMTFISLGLERINQKYILWEQRAKDMEYIQGQETHKILVIFNKNKMCQDQEHMVKE